MQEKRPGTGLSRKSDGGKLARNTNHLELARKGRSLLQSALKRKYRALPILHKEDRGGLCNSWATFNLLSGVEGMGRMRFFEVLRVYTLEGR